MQALARCKRESGDVVAADELLGKSALLFERTNQLQGFLAFGFDAREGLAEQVSVLDRSFRQRPVQTLDLSFRDGKRLAQLLRLRRIIVGTSFGAGDQGREENFQPLGSENLLLDFGDDQIVEIGHRNTAPPASRFTFVHAVVAGVVTIAPALAGAQRHPAAAGGAFGNPGQQCRPVDDARRLARRTARFQPTLRRLEYMRLDNDGRLEGDPFAALLALASAPFFAIEVMPPGIGFSREDFVDAAGIESSPALRNRLTVKFMRDGADTVSGAIHIEHHAHYGGFRRLNGELLLDRIGAGFDDDRLVAEGWTRAVPESLPRVLLHRAQDVLGILAALVFIEHRAELAEHLPARIICHGLRNGDQRDIVLFQRAAMQLELEGVAEKAREAMDQHHIEGAVSARGIVHHTLELRALVVGSRCAGLDIFSDDFPALVLRPSLQLVALVGDGQVFFRLPRR